MNLQAAFADINIGNQSSAYYWLEKRLLYGKPDFSVETGLPVGLAYRSSASGDACCAVAHGFQSRRILQAFPFSFCAGVDCRLHSCARARRARVAVATTRADATIRVAGQLAVAASTRVRTGLDWLLYCGFGRVVRHAQMAARVAS